MPFPMNQFDGFRFFGHGCDPIDESLLIRMGGVAGQGVHAGFDRSALPVEDGIAAWLFCIFLDGPAWGAGGLIANEENVVCGLFDAILQVTDDPAAGAHPTAGQDNSGAFAFTEFQMVPVVFDGIEAVKVDWMVPPAFQIVGLLVPKFRELVINAGDLQAQGRIHEDGRALPALQFREQFTVKRIAKNPVHFIDQFLGAPQGKGRDEDLAAVRQCPRENSPELFDALMPIGVQSIAVGGFHDHQIGTVRRLRIDQDRRICCADVSGKENRPAAFIVL